MLYHELYGSYYRTVAAILEKALTGPVTRADMVRLCNELSFGDAALNIPDALLKGDWALLTADHRAVLTRAPHMPLTLLERRWLKAVSLDPRVQLFDADFSFLGDVEPLFRPEDIIAFDRYGDGDDYADPAYQATFRLLMQAIDAGNTVRMTYASRRQKTRIGMTEITESMERVVAGPARKSRVMTQKERTTIAGMNTFTISRERAPPA